MMDVGEGGEGGEDDDGERRRREGGVPYIIVRGCSSCQVVGATGNDTRTASYRMVAIFRPTIDLDSDGHTGCS
jgi:hypothetical protein